MGKKFFLFFLFSVFLFSCEKDSANAYPVNSDKSHSTAKLTGEKLALPNPVKQSSETELMDLLGMRFAVPMGAEDIHYSIVADKMAQMDFTYDGNQCVARIRSSVQFEDISGFFYDWENEGPVRIGWCEGEVKYNVEGDDVCGICLWWDATPGLMYSLGMRTGATPELLQQLAEEVYVATQGEVQ
ncbi:MAG: hypothetical protein IIW10_06495 [Spirochaetaceae bacterium]|nr:hypothetical protein [Spirochaetaceae bacterium]